MGIQKMLLNVSEKIKPILKKIFPQKMLRNIKDTMLDNQLNQLIKEGKEPFDRSAHPDGINLIGLVRAEMGLGQSCRLLNNMIEHTKYPVSLCDFNIHSKHLRSEDHSLDQKITNELKYNINLIHINPDEMKLLYTKTNANQWHKRYNIAFWLWELEDIPESWHQYFSLLDEIWTPSEFISRSLRKVTDLPVTTIPYCVKAPASDKYSREFFQLPEDRFLFLTMYDSNSTMERKNPMGAVTAFKKAFSPQDDKVGLVIKINNARDEDLSILHQALEGYSNVYYITNTMSKIQVNSLLKCVDVFVSLHRAEGFGLVMAEAMLNGVPVIATNWSSNTEFMNEKVGCMVDYKFVKLEKDQPPYKAGAVWAEPDTGQASEYMRRLFSDVELYDTLSREAKAYVTTKLSMSRAVDLIEERLKDIYKEE